MKRTTEHQKGSSQPVDLLHHPIDLIAGKVRSREISEDHQIEIKSGLPNGRKGADIFRRIFRKIRVTLGHEKLHIETRIAHQHGSKVAILPTRRPFDIEDFDLFLDQGDKPLIGIIH